MSDNPLDRIPAFDRVSIRAVVVEDGADPGPALTAAGIFDPIALPMVFGESQPDSSFGDGITPNLTVVLEPDQQDDDECEPGTRDPEAGSHDSVASRHDLEAGTPLGTAKSATTGESAAGPATANLPAAYGIQPLAPVPGSSRTRQPPHAAPPSPGRFLQDPIGPDGRTERSSTNGQMSRTAVATRVGRLPIPAMSQRTYRVAD